jgi:hypothetical protein
MHKQICAAFAVMGLLLQAGAARAADTKTCDAYVKEATAKAQGIRQFNCGFDVNDPRWSSDRNGHAAWCKTADKEMVARESTLRRGEIKLCQTCRNYAALAVAAAADNVSRKCGYDGPRWGSAPEAHFGWCMAQHTRPAADEKDLIAAEKDALAKLPVALNPETGRRAVLIALCRRRPMTEPTPSRKR